MKSILLFFSLFIHVLPFNQSIDVIPYKVESVQKDTLVKVDDIFFTYNLGWVEYQNEVKQPWSNTEPTMSKIGSSCFLENGQLAIVIGLYNENMSLCMYRTDNDGMGTACENGTYFLMSNLELVKSQNEYEIYVDDTLEKYSKIKQLVEEYEKRLNKKL